MMVIDHKNARAGDAVPAGVARVDAPDAQAGAGAVVPVRRDGLEWLGCPGSRGVKADPRWQPDCRHDILGDGEALRELYATHTLQETAEICRCSHWSVQQAMIRHGIARRASNTPIGGPDPRYDILEDGPRLAALYQEHTTHDIAAMCYCSQSTVRRYMETFHIPIRRKGARPPGQRVVSRDQLPRLVARAYLKADRCPPDCGGRMECLDHGCKARALYGEV